MWVETDALTSSFDKFEGYGDSSKRAAKLERASAWFKVLKVSQPVRHHFWHNTQTLRI